MFRRYGDVGSDATDGIAGNTSERYAWGKRETEAMLYSEQPSTFFGGGENERRRTRENMRAKCRCGGRLHGVVPGVGRAYSYANEGEDDDAGAAGTGGRGEQSWRMDAGSRFAFQPQCLACQTPTVDP